MRRRGYFTREGVRKACHMVIKTEVNGVKVEATVTYRGDIEKAKERYAKAIGGKNDYERSS